MAWQVLGFLLRLQSLALQYTILIELVENVAYDLAFDIKPKPCTKPGWDSLIQSRKKYIWLLTSFGLLLGKVSTLMIHLPSRQEKINDKHIYGCMPHVHVADGRLTV